LGDVNAIEVLHHAVLRHWNLPVLVQRVTELGIHLLKFACNGKIIDHTKEEDKLAIESPVVQTRSMCSVLELERDKYKMAMDGPGDYWGQEQPHQGEVKYQGTVSSTNIWKLDRSACNISARENLMRRMHWWYRRARGTYPATLTEQSEVENQYVVVWVH
jgi:hypothetical protein